MYHGWFLPGPEKSGRVARRCVTFGSGYRRETLSISRLDHVRRILSRSIACDASTSRRQRKRRGISFRLSFGVTFIRGRLTELAGKLDMTLGIRRAASRQRVGIEREASGAPLLRKAEIDEQDPRGSLISARY